MILDNLINFRKYICLNRFFPEVAVFLEKNDLQAMAPGRYEIGSGGVFAMVQEYMTKSVDQCFIECHRKYIDIQIVPEGREKIGICGKSECREGSYDEEKDMQVLSGDVFFIGLKPGAFAVFFPHDGHMPQVCFQEGPECLRKIVIKVPAA